MQVSGDHITSQERFWSETPAAIHSRDLFVSISGPGRQVRKSDVTDIINLQNCLSAASGASRVDRTWLTREDGQDNGKLMSDSAVRSNEDLIRASVYKIGEGNEQALADLYEHTSTLVYSVALRLLGDRADAEEATLDVYSQVWRGAATFRAERGSVTAWLLMITRTRAIDRLRAKRRRSEQELDGAIPQLSDTPARALTPEQFTITTERRRRVREALAVLPAPERELLELAFYGGYTQSELASRTGIPLGTVKTRMRTGMGRLREAFSGLTEAGAL